MYLKILSTIVIVFLVLITGCSSIKKIVFNPEINQGNYFTSDDISKISIGMTKQQITYILGTPMITDPFNANIWFYIFRQEQKHKFLIQKTLVLTFNDDGLLINIDNKFD